MLTLKEIAQTVQMPESTLRLYRDEFEEFLPAHGEARRRRYSETTAANLRRVAGWKRDGWTATQIRDTLAREAEPEAKARRRNTDERLDEIAALLRAQAGEVAMLRVEVGALRAEVGRLASLLRADAPPSIEEAIRAGRGEGRGAA